MKILTTIKNKIYNFKCACLCKKNKYMEYTKQRLKGLKELCHVLKLGVLYAKPYIKMPFKLTSCSLVLGLIIIWSIECPNNVWLGIGQSIVAGYIFYIFVDLVPKIFESYHNASNLASTYRTLQLLLDRFDSLFIKPYEYVYGKKINFNVVDVYAFFNKCVHEYATEFKIRTEIIEIDARDVGGGFQHPEFIAYAYSQWGDIKTYIDELLNMPYTSKIEKICYMLYYLKSESPISIYFEILQEINEPPDYCKMIGLDNMESYNNFIRNIIQLHEIAFSMYQILARDSRWTQIYPVPFQEQI